MMAMICETAEEYDKREVINTGKGKTKGGYNGNTSFPTFVVLTSCFLFIYFILSIHLC
jgi:hypothetical protein